MFKKYRFAMILFIIGTVCILGVAAVAIAQQISTNYNLGADTTVVNTVAATVKSLETSEETTIEPTTELTVEEESTMFAIHKSVDVQILDKTVLYEDLSIGLLNDHIILKIQCTNLTSEAIKGFKCSIGFFDMFDSKIANIELEHTDSLQPGEVLLIDEDDSSYSVNPYISNNVKFRDANFNDLTYKIRFEKIIFQDGTVIGK